MRKRSIPYMKKRTAIIGALVSLMPLGQPLVIVTGAVLTSAGVILSVPEKVNAESSVFYYNRGNDKYDVGDYYGAIADYTKAIEISPREADAYYNRGLAKHDLNDYYGAIADYTKAIEINPREADAYVNRSMVKEEIGDLNGACVDARKAVYFGDRDRENRQWLKENC